MASSSTLEGAFCPKNNSNFYIVSILETLLLVNGLHLQTCRTRNTYAKYAYDCFCEARNGMKVQGMLASMQCYWAAQGNQ